MTARRPGLLGLAALLALLSGVPSCAESSSPRPPDGLRKGIVVRVADGDTITVRLPEGQMQVRLIGVDAPEARHPPAGSRRPPPSLATRALGQRAATFTERRLLGERVALESDVERRDKYGRVLAYVWRSDGTLFNAELLREGYAQTMTVLPNVKYADLLARLQREARDARRGLWAEGLQVRGRRNS